jgi:hypothetical protein
MATMIDLLDAAHGIGLPVEVVPDFLTNGHNGIKTLSPKCGYLHHTDSTTLTSVYCDPLRRPGWPTEEWRPDVPVPRCQVYASRARAAGCRSGCQFKGKPHLVFVSAGVAYQAGMANSGRIAAARAGRITAATPDAAGLADDVNANNDTMGIEIDWRTGEDWPADLLALVCRLMALAVTVFGWPGVGSWIRHRQATHRKPDPQTDYDFWTHAASGEQDVSIVDAATKTYLDGKFGDLIQRIQATGQRLATVQAAIGLQADDEGHLTTAIGGAQTAILGELVQSPSPVWYVRVDGRPERYEVIGGGARHLTYEEWVARGLTDDVTVPLDPVKDAGLLTQLGITTTPAA